MRIVGVVEGCCMDDRKIKWQKKSWPRAHMLSARPALSGCVLGIANSSIRSSVSIVARISLSSLPRGADEAAPEASPPLLAMSCVDDWLCVA